jgi:protein SCO1
LTTSDTPPPGARRAPSHRPTTWLLLAAAGLIAGVLVFWLGAILLARAADRPPVYATLPDFELDSSSGAAFRRADLEGRVWVVGFIFTRCQSICPLITEAMKGLAARLEAEGVERVGLLSITVDPEFDRPEVLRAYAADRGIDATSQRVPWVLLTGAPDAVRALVVDGFLTAMGEPVEQAGGWIDIAHGGRLALVDRRGDVRGYFATDAADLDQLHRAVLALAR